MAGARGKAAFFRFAFIAASSALITGVHRLSVSNRAGIPAIGSVLHLEWNQHGCADGEWRGLITGVHRLSVSSRAGIPAIGSVLHLEWNQHGCADGEWRGGSTASGNPAMTPDQVKARLMRTAFKNLPPYTTVVAHVDLSPLSARSYDLAEVEVLDRSRKPKADPGTYSEERRQSR